MWPDAPPVCVSRVRLKLAIGLAVAGLRGAIIVNTLKILYASVFVFACPTKYLTAGKNKIKSRAAVHEDANAVGLTFVVGRHSSAIK